MSEARTFCICPAHVRELQKPIISIANADNVYWVLGLTQTAEPRLNNCYILSTSHSTRQTALEMPQCCELLHMHPFLVSSSSSFLFFTVHGVILAARSTEERKGKKRKRTKGERKTDEHETSLPTGFIDIENMNTYIVNYQRHLSNE